MNWKKLFSGVLQKEAETDNSHGLQLATAVLFLELAYADFELTADETDHMHSSLKNYFNLSQTEVEELIKLAGTARDTRDDIYLFTSQLKAELSHEERAEIVTMLWGLVFADGNLDGYEEVLIKRISRLLGMSRGEMITIKNHVLGH